MAQKNLRDGNLCKSSEGSLQQVDAIERKPGKKKKKKSTSASLIIGIVVEGREHVLYHSVEMVRLPFVLNWQWKKKMNCFNLVQICKGNWALKRFRMSYLAWKKLRTLVPVENVKGCLKYMQFCACTLRLRLVFFFFPSSGGGGMMKRPRRSCGGSCGGLKIYRVDWTNSTGWPKAPAVGSHGTAGRKHLKATNKRAELNSTRALGNRTS